MFYYFFRSRVAALEAHLRRQKLVPRAKAIIKAVAAVVEALGAVIRAEAMAVAVPAEDLRRGDLEP